MADMLPSGDVAVPPGTDILTLSRRLNVAYEQLVSSGRAGPGVRQLVLDSWTRSLAEGIDPERTPPEVRIDDDSLVAIRDAHPLSAGMEVIRRLLVGTAAESGLLVAVSDATGRLLWVEGARSLRSRAEGMNFVPGADWSESGAGTNAPGTALALDRAVQIFGPEHLARQVTSWSCSAAPIHDPDTGAVLGVLDLTGGPDVATRQTLNLVRATVAAVEAELRLERLNRPAAGHRPVRGHPPVAPPTGTLDVLGGHGGVLRVGASTRRLTLRHSELLLLLLESADGMTSGELAMAISDHEAPQVTIRAEVSRLRLALEPLELLSRPYRTGHRITTDVQRVRQALRDGRLRHAVALYRGPVLPGSTAPGVERLRDELHMQLRSRLLVSEDAEALLCFADASHGHDDWEIWQHALSVLPASSPRRRQVEERLERLDAELR